METIVIVGGGAGGLELATRLGDTLGITVGGSRSAPASGQPRHRRARIVLVDRWPGHFWKPLLHTVASGACDPQLAQLAFAAQAAGHHFEFVQGEVVAVNRASRCIELAGADSTAPRRRIGYDRLVLALGAVTNFYGVAGAAEHALTLDDVSQAETFRRRFIDACVAAGQHKERDDDQRGQVHVVIVGGGATGVELAAELCHSARALARYKVHALDPVRDVHISLVERGERLLPHLAPALSERAASQLRALGVTVLTGTAVASVGADTLQLEPGDGAARTHRADLTVWAAGVEAPALCATLGLPLNGLRQVRVDDCLRADGDASIHAFGDCASQSCAPGDKAPPPRAQVAHQQAMFLALWLARAPALPGSNVKAGKAGRRHDDNSGDNSDNDGDDDSDNDGSGGAPDGNNSHRHKGAREAGFRYRDYGSLVSLGKHGAVGVLHGVAAGSGWQVDGAWARLLYGLMYQKHLLSLHGMARTTLQALADWLRARLAPLVRLG